MSDRYVVVFTGLPGTGKSTLADRLATDAGVPALMARVAREGATVAVVVPATLDVQPGYRPFVEMAEGQVGPAARSILHTYWNCGDLAS